MIDFSENERKEAGRVLGLRDDDLESIRLDQRSREAVLLTLKLNQIRLASERKGFDIATDQMRKKLGSYLKAKNLANQRADLAEAKLKSIQKILGEHHE